MKTRYVLLGVVGLGIVVGLWLAHPVQAQISVTTTEDELNSDGDCSLREAVEAANTNNPVDNCIDNSGNYNYIIIADAQTYMLGIPGFNEDANQTGDLDITEDVTIEGAGPWQTIINAADIDRALHILTGFVTVRNLTITDGSTDTFFGDGGCILVNGSLSLENSVVYSCLAGNSGGGIYVAPGASLDIYFSEIVENGAGGSGGGIFVASGAWVGIIENTTIHNNYANQNGGGIFNIGTIWDIVSTTISSNRAELGNGGGIFNGSSGTIGGVPATILNTTISSNSAVFGGGIFNAGQISDVIHVTIAYNDAVQGGGIRNVSSGSFGGIQSSIIANSINGGDCSNAGSMGSLGYNILGDNSCSSVFTSTGDLLNTDPMLGPLQNNGGLTATHALLPGSPAIDHVDEFVCPWPDVDQRGFARPIDGDGDSFARCDSGAFEFLPPTGADVSITKSDTPDPVGVGQDLTYTIVVTNNGPEATASEIFVSDQLPSGVDFVSVTTTQGSCSFDSLTNSIGCDLGILDPDQTVTITVVVRPRDEIAGEIISNCAGAFMLDGNDPNLDNNESCVETRVQGLADLSVTKLDNPDPVMAGNDLTYTITVTNDGPNDATGVTLTDTLPSGVTFVSASPGCSFAAPNSVICSLGTLAANSSVDVTIVVRPNTPGVITNIAAVTAAEDDPNPNNNQDSEETEVQGVADLSITKTDQTDPVVVGQDLSYTLVVTDNGPSLATNVVLTDTLPGGVIFVSAVPSQGTCAYNAGVVTCSLGTLAAGARATVTITVQPTVGNIGTIVNRSEVTSDALDPTPDDNQDDEPTQVLSGQGIIRGFKWLDLDGDGHKASYEPFLRGITIRVTGTDIWGNPVSLSAVTDAQGQFVFVNLPPGTYLVCEVRPDVISYQTFPRSGPICPNSEFPGYEITLGDGEIREIAFGNVFDELYFEPLGSAVQAVPQRDGILFRPQHAFVVKELRVEIYDLQGRVIYRSPWASEGVLWTLRNERGQRVARGVYLYIVTIQTVEGTVVTSRVQKLMVR